jgi:hypothetical protein
VRPRTGSRCWLVSKGQSKATNRQIRGRSDQALNSISCRTRPIPSCPTQRSLLVRRSYRPGALEQRLVGTPLHQQRHEVTDAAIDESLLGLRHSDHDFGRRKVGILRNETPSHFVNHGVLTGAGHRDSVLPPNPSVKPDRAPPFTAATHEVGPSVSQVVNQPAPLQDWRTSTRTVNLNAASGQPRPAVRVATARRESDGRSAGR